MLSNSSTKSQINMNNLRVIVNNFPVENKFDEFVQKY